MLQRQVIEREGSAGVNIEEPALLRGVQHGAVAVDRDVRAGRDGDLPKVHVVAAVKVHIERERGRSAARDFLDTRAKASPRGGGEAVQAGLGREAFACSQQSLVAESSSGGSAHATGGERRECSSQHGCVREGVKERAAGAPGSETWR